MKNSVEDLSSRARRGDLGETELRELEQLLEGSQEARLAHRAGQEFDAEDSVLAGDEALAARINQRLFERRPEPRRLRRFRAIGLVVGGVCTTVAAAAAGPGLLHEVKAFWWRDSIEVQTHDASRSGPRAPASTMQAPRPPIGHAQDPSAPLASESAAMPEPPIPAGQAAVPDPRPKRAAAPATADVAETSAALFARASLARRHGAVREAIDLYGQVLRRFPGSAEAAQAQVTLGALRLQSGAPGAGLRHFESYLARYPGGPLAAEALWGKTRALAALGRDDEARRDLQLLLDRYPRSTYATAARAKLGLPP